MKLFGSYLIEQGLVTREQVLQALDTQHIFRVPIGRIAVSEGKMSETQVLETLNCHTDYDQSFGAAALKLGFLRTDDLQHLLRVQKAETRLIGEILVEMGAIDRPTMESKLQEFLEAAESSQSEPQLR